MQPQKTNIAEISEETKKQSNDKNEN